MKMVYGLFTVQHEEKSRDYINITPQVQTAVEKNGIREGLCLVNAMHITASVHINDDESGPHHGY